MKSGDTLQIHPLSSPSVGGLRKNLVRCSFDCMLASCKPADLYLQSPHLFWKKSKCPLNWAGGQHNLPILFVTTRLMAGLALSLVVTSFTLRCLFSSDYNNGLVFTGTVISARGASASAAKQPRRWVASLWKWTMVSLT